MFTRALLADYLWVPTAEVKDVKKVKSLLTVVPRYSEEIIPLWKESTHGVYLGIPLYHFRFHDQVAENIIDYRSKGEEIAFNIKSKFRPGQEDLLKQFSDKVESGITGFVLQAPPGFGKTVVAINMIARLGRTALVVVPRSNLAQQWIDRFVEHTDLDRDEIGMAIGGGISEWEGCKVVIGLVHTLALDRFGPKFRKYFGTVVFDEVDRSVPPQTFAPVASMFPSRYRIGVSATMNRQDAMEVVFQKHIGQCFLKGADANRMVPKVLIHEYPGFSGRVYATATLNARGQFLSRIAENRERTGLVAKYVYSILKSERRVVVLSDRISQLIDIQQILLASRWAENKDIGFYVRRLPGKEVKAKDRERVARVSKVILATYGMFALGTDIPELAGIVYATPQSETKQSKGRVEREFKGKKQPVVIDIVDTAYDMARRWGAVRERQYIGEGLKIKKVRG